MELARTVADLRSHLDPVRAAGGRVGMVGTSGGMHVGHQSLIRRAAAVIRPGGVCWLVANRHLPYEQVLAEAFKSVRLDIEAGGYKVYEARR